MKTSNVKFIAIYSLLLAFLLSDSISGFAQEKYSGHAQSVSVNGTSTLHDWEMKSNKGECDALITVNNGKITFSRLSFIVPAKSLKSGHGVMDKNTYKALNTDKNPNISFVLSSGNLTSSGKNTYHFKGVGNLTIAGTTKETELLGTVTYDPADKSFTCTGTKKFKMTEYGVKPPKVMMGTIKTGDAISISYSLTIKT